MERESGSTLLFPIKGVVIDGLAGSGGISRNVPNFQTGFENSITK
jgi:hypothetical protein